MAKYYGKIGYGISEETVPGVWKKKIIEREYFGDILTSGWRWEQGEKVNDDLCLTNRISIIADLFANSNIGAAVYIEYQGAKWKIRSVELAYPRIIITLGGVYYEQSEETSGETGEDTGGYESIFPTSG